MALNMALPTPQDLGLQLLKCRAKQLIGLAIKRDMALSLLMPDMISMSGTRSNYMSKMF